MSSAHDHDEAPDQAPAIAGLFDFVSARVCEAGGAATAAGDEVGRRFQDRTLAIINGMRDDLATDPRRADEVEGWNPDWING